MRKSYWLSSSTDKAKFPRLDRDIDADVAVIGGGIAGVTAALLLKRQGFKVSLLERYHCGAIDTGHTTSHLTFVTDMRLPQLVKTFGKEHARAAWDAGRAAIMKIHELVHEEEADCDFAWVPGYLHSPLASRSDERRRFRSEAALAAELGFQAAYRPEVPVFGKPGILFPDQAKIHPIRYLRALAARIPGKGSHVFESSEVKEILEGPLRVKAGGFEVRCEWVVIATHVPLMGVAGLAGATLFQTKLAPYSSYAICARLPKDSAPQALFWDTSDPYAYLRIDCSGGTCRAIYGGEDHKTGQKGKGQPFERLEAKLSRIFPGAKLTHRWTGQVVETPDGLPYIGESAEKQFIATGFAGNGITFGTLAGMMACDRIAGRSNPWEELFSPGRKKLRGSAWDYIKENADYPYYMLRDRIFGAEANSLSELPAGEGRLVRMDGEKLAVFRRHDGKLVKLSPVCTHMGCHVRWNSEDKTWDCPCHGSRFEPEGGVLAGPAEEPLAVASPVKKKAGRNGKSGRRR